ncbi:restriction endonuclease [Demequina pelophila]|uniref:restriction endonuclease n=1 Tax=Demequina pelophila TaxID=1638984 RepID=UPI000785AB51|nr:restriction endonuclease [Demequina pelophila]
MSDPAPSRVPIWPEFVRPVLLTASQEAVVSRRTLVARSIDLLDLDDDAREETLDSGGSRAHNRAQWAITHATKAGLVARVARGEYELTDAGRAWLTDFPTGIHDFSTANEFFTPFWPEKTRAAAPAVEASPASETTDPIELIEDGVALIKAEVAATLLDRLRGADPAFFEQAVVEVLLAMGYGGSEQRGKRIGGTGDGGVDGVIDQDALGLDQIYVQAKRYNAGNTVGREAIQAFIGALHGFGASRGVFITSSDFTQHARDYARQIPTRIILINGDRLAELMIKYRVGVQVEKRYDVVKVDEDFFE